MYNLTNIHIFIFFTIVWIKKLAHNVMILIIENYKMDYVNANKGLYPYNRIYNVKNVFNIKENV